MNPKIVIRNETDADVSAIAEVTVAAFKTLEISNHTEQFIIAALRAAGALTISLVAERDGRVVGHIAFSPVAMSDGSPGWYGLGPVSVLPEYQRQGIGGALIQEGLSRLKGLGARGCCLVGHPEYYKRFGFRNTRGLGHEGVPEDVFFAMSFDGHMPRDSLSSTKDSKRLANKRVLADAFRAHLTLNVRPEAIGRSRGGTQNERRVHTTHRG